MSESGEFREHSIVPASVGLVGQNIALLNTTEAGRLLIDPYKAALDCVPDLAATMRIVPGGEALSGFKFRAFPRWQTADGVHDEVQVPIDDGLAWFKAERRAAKAEHLLIAGMLGIHPRELTPEVCSRFSIAHEIGHAVVYLNWANSPDSYETAVAQAKHNTALALNQKYPGPVRSHIDVNGYTQYLRGVSRRERSDRAQAYRQRFPEKEADEFAVRLFREYNLI